MSEDFDNRQTARDVCVRRRWPDDPHAGSNCTDLQEGVRDAGTGIDRSTRGPMPLIDGQRQTSFRRGLVKAAFW
jgi:hypothetical protein